MDIPGPAAPVPPASRAYLAGTLRAWAAVVGVLALHFFPPGGEGDPEMAEGIAEAMFRIQARSVVGLAELLPSPGDGRGSGGALRQFSRGPAGHRQRFAVVVAELSGPAEGLAALDELDRVLAAEGVAATPRQAEVSRILRALWEGPAADLPARAAAVPAPDRAILLEALDWFGRLALAPEGGDLATREAVVGPARRAALGMLVIAGAAVLVLLAGIAGGVVFLVLLLRRSLVLRFDPGGTPPGVYAEAFAIWLVLLVGLQLLAALVAPRGAGLWLSLPCSLGSLAALFWPRLRGVPAATLRRDLGLSLPGPAWREVLAGVATYVMTLPLLAAGVVVTIVLAQLQAGHASPEGPLAPLGGPAHPAIVPLASGDPVQQVLVLFLAAVVAPFVEELAFRGLLYAHLRGASAALPRGLSVLLAAGGNALLFAAIHPQGWVAIPALGAIAVGLSIAREWRGSILACMVAHGLSNALVFSVQIVVLAD